MSLIEGIGDEVTNFLLIIFTASILYFGWRSTNVRDERIQRPAYLIIERTVRSRREGLATIITLRTAPLQTTTATNNDTTDELEQQQRTLPDLSNPSPTINNNIHQITEAPSLESILDEVSDLAVGSNPYRAGQTTFTRINHTTDLSGPQQIIREMDAVDNSESDGLRHRRPASTSNYQLPQNAVASTSAAALRAAEQNAAPQPIPSTSKAHLNHQDSTDKSENTDNCTNENSENGNVFEELSYDDDDDDDDDDDEARPLTCSLPIARQHSIVTATASGSESSESEFRIKLKYLNDNLKLVKGCPSEAIGDFMKKHFSEELSDQKMVRLVFNGHVLQPDSKTLQACGLFDNCVVHCLVHNQRAAAAATASSNDPSSTRNSANDLGSIDMDNLRGGSNSNVQYGQRLMYIGMFLLSLTLVFCWYFRLQYHHLFSLYSTIGLLILTVIFIIIFPILYLIEREVTTSTNASVNTTTAPPPTLSASTTTTTTTSATS